MTYVLNKWITYVLTTTSRHFFFVTQTIISYYIDLLVGSLFVCELKNRSPQSVELDDKPMEMKIFKGKTFSIYSSSSSFFFFILFNLINIYIYIYIVVFLEERDIKVEQNYIFSLVFNRGGLWNPNWANLK